MGSTAMIETTLGELEHPAAGARFRPDIEGLRAVAILLVVAFHVGIPGWRGGFVGVDVFFVVSGYLITGLLVREIEHTGRLDIVRFYARRARRLLPAFAAMLLATLLAGAIFLAPDERVVSARTAFASSLYASNLWFQFYSSGYFGPDTGDNPLLHTWSLAVEEQFYLVWPIVVILALATLRSRRALVGVMIGISLASFAACLWLIRVDAQSAFFSSPGRAWEFSVGGLAALVSPTAAACLDRFSGAVAAVGLAAILASGVLLDPGAAFPGGLALFPVLGTAALMMSGVSARSGVVRWLLATRPMQQIGRLSYSWYLWHWPVLIIGTAAFPSIDVFGRLGLALLALGAAAACHVLIENPIRYQPFLVARPLAMLGLAAAITLVTVGSSRVAKSSAVLASDTPLQRAIAEARRAVPPGLYGTGCFLDYPVVRTRECAFGALDSPTTIVLFGDSHAAQWFAAFETIARQQGWRLIVLTKAGCPTADVEVLRWTGRRMSYGECSIWRQAALQRIAELRPAAVILGNSDNHVTRPGDAGPDRLSMAQWRGGMRRTLEQLSEEGLRSVTLRDTPGPGLDVPKCLSRANAQKPLNDVCSMPRSRALRDDVYQASREAATGIEGAATLDLTDQFCSSDTCPARVGGLIVYGAPGHIANGFALSLAGVLARRITPLVMPGRAATF